MAKTIRKTIQISTRKRNNSVKINEEFYSYDKNNAQFEFIMDYDVPADKVIALFHFEQTNRYYETVCQFKGNLITIEFDTSLIVEDELVTGYLYFDKLDKSTDVYRFTFGARLSEIDKTRELPVEEKVSRRIVPVADIVTKQELEELMDKIKKNSGTYDDAEIRNSLSAISERVQTLENKPDNDTRYDDSDVKSRLSALESNASKYLTEHQPLTSIEERIQQVEARFNNLSNIYLSSHQSLEHLVTKKELEDKHYLTSVPEEVINKISALETKVKTLENKSVVTHEELEQAGYLKEHQPLTDYATNSKVEAVENRVLALENKPSVIQQTYDDSALSGRVSALEAKQDKDTIYNDEEIKRRLTTLEGKTDNFITGVSVNKEGSNVTLTYNYVDGQSKNVSFTDSDTVNVAYDDSGLKQRITNLENRPQIDVTTLVSKTELPNLIQHQSLEEYAKKSELPAPYNDSALVSRINVLEAKTDNDTVYDDSEVKRRLTELEARPTGTSYNDKPLSDRVKVLEDTPKVDATEYNSFKENTAHTVDVIRNRLSSAEKALFARPSIPTLSLNDNTLSISGGNSVTLPTHQSEMRGTGMPNGVVEAEIGTTYVDKNKTNGALKWIKTTDGGTTGWKVVEGDTGWITVFTKKNHDDVKRSLKIRRINNMVNVLFEGESYGEQYIQIVYDNDFSNKKLMANGKITDGFKPASTISVPAHSEKLDNNGFADAGAFLFDIQNNTFEINLFTSSGLYNQISNGFANINFNYVTYEPWPTQLPTIQ